MKITLEKMRGIVAERPLLSPQMFSCGGIGMRGGAPHFSHRWPLGRVRMALAGERGAVTAEYVIVVLAALAFAGLLLAVMRGGGLQDLLGSVIKNAINALL